jgi:hypothetical protein
MPHQDQFYAGYVPLNWQDLREVLAGIDVACPEEPSFEFVDKTFEIDHLGMINVDGIGWLPVRLYYCTWDGDYEQDILDPEVMEHHKTGLIVGVKLTSRYRPAVLDRDYEAGRPDFFEFDLPLVAKICAGIEHAIKRKATLVSACQFY